MLLINLLFLYPIKIEKRLLIIKNAKNNIRTYFKFKSFLKKKFIRKFEFRSWLNSEKKFNMIGINEKMQISIKEKIIIKIIIDKKSIF